MVRAQLSRHNGRVVKVEDYEEPRARRLVDRPLNLSFTTNMPPENRVTAGRFWAEAKPGAGADTIPPQFSVETGIAESFGLKLGDEISFRIAEQEVTGKITSLRAVQWDTFHVNFFVIGTPALLAGQPTTYITSFHLSATEKGLVRRLGKRFPGITVVDVEALIAHVRAVMDRANSAVEFVFLFSLAAGLLILAAAIGATHDERLIEGAVLKALGARRRTILAGLLAEFAVLGGVAGLVAALGAAGMGAILALWVFHVPYTVSPVLFLAGPPAGIAIVVGAGLFGTRSIFRQSPAAVLRGL
jgi:putative ABC transport system permease protein